MKIIDLTLELSNDYPVYPGDPEVNIELIQDFEHTTWNMRRINMNGHDGTHVNAQIHGMASGKNLDDYKLEDFAGDCILFTTVDEIEAGVGLIVASRNIDMDLAKQIVEKMPKFIGLSSEFEMDVDVEKYFFALDLLVFERIANCDKLPKRFMFYGLPLRIKNGDGSPIRAVAVVD